MSLASLDLVETTIGLPGCELAILRPRDSEALLDEEAFERDEFMPYWAELWPSGLALARAVCRRPVRGLRVLELGCGLAIPSIAAALQGARVLATDWSADALALVGTNARRSGADLEVATCSWASPEPIVAAGPWDLVLASDVLYERRNVPLLLALLSRLVTAKGEILVADPGRPPAPEFLQGATRAFRVASRHDELAPHVRVHAMRRR